MTVETITSYKTSDGTLHVTQEQAQYHQKVLNFNDFYEYHGLIEEYDSGDYPIDRDKVREWLERNKSMLLPILEDF